MNSEFRPSDHRIQKDGNIHDIEENNFYGDFYPKRIVVANYLGKNI